MSFAYIYDAVRTPRGKGRQSGSLHGTRPIELVSTVLKSLQQRNDLDTQKVSDVIFGCVTQTGEQGGCIAKAATTYSGYHQEVSAVTLNRFCGSGLEAINQGAANIAAGFFDLIIAGGVESMSRVPMGLDGGPWGSDPEVMAQTAFVPQGISADLITTLGGITREEVDKLALLSQERASVAWQEKRFEKSIVPLIDMNGLKILSTDEHMRPDTTLEGLAKLKPSFADLGERLGFDAVALAKYPQLEKIVHIHHAGNSSGIVDGAAAVLLGSQQVGKELGLKARAKIRSVGLIATDPTLMLTGIAPACRMALEKAELSIDDIDLIEVNEAFAGVVIHFIRDMGIDLERVNVNGGAIAMGHPLGATGAMILGTLLDELERAKKTLGMAALCIGGGMGIATVIEKV